jgi:hypothetical protein
MRKDEQVDRPINSPDISGYSRILVLNLQAAWVTVTLGSKLFAIVIIVSFVARIEMTICHNLRICHGHPGSEQKGTPIQLCKLRRLELIGTLDRCFTT